jgi:hypothetical protein
MASRRNTEWLSAVIALCWLGCDQPSATPVSSTKSLPLAVSTQTVVPSDTSATPPAASEENPAPEAAPPSGNPPVARSPVQAPGAAPTTTPAPSAPRIQLSTGVALAQTLPDGTSVLCSIDYHWVSGGAQPGVDYFWVVELGNGQRMNGSANVSKRSGTIQAILRGVKPDQGPFKAAIFMRSSSPGLSPEQISDFINLTH